MPDDRVSIPGVRDADLEKVARGLLSVPDLGASRIERFFGQVQAIVDARAQACWPNEGAANLSLFFQAPYPRFAAKSLNCRPIADLDATTEPILGRIFLLNGDASQGFCADLPVDDPGEVFAWLQELSFCNEPNIAVYRDTGVMIERAMGVSGPASRKERIRSEAPAATPDQLLDGLDRFHQSELITPHVCPKGVWLGGASSKYYIGDDPERTIQAQLRTFLNGWFRKVLRAECEDSTRAGRIDVRLLKDEPGEGLAYWAIVELKVVKSYVYIADRARNPRVVSPRQNAEAVAEGVRQAHEFAKERNCLPGYLEIFDLRKDKVEDVLSHDVVDEQVKAVDPAPVINIRPLFGSASDARKAGALR
jgi:hypothetical protein